MKRSRKNSGNITIEASTLNISKTMKNRSKQMRRNADEEMCFDRAAELIARLDHDEDFE